MQLDGAAQGGGRLKRSRVCRTHIVLCSMLLMSCWCSWAPEQASRPPLSTFHPCPATVPTPPYPNCVRTAPLPSPAPDSWTPHPPMQVTWALQRWPAPVSVSHARSAKAMAARHSALPPGVSGALSPSSCTEQGAEGGDKRAVCNSP